MLFSDILIQLKIFYPHCESALQIPLYIQQLPPHVMVNHHLKLKNLVLSDPNYFLSPFFDNLLSLRQLLHDMGPLHRQIFHKVTYPNAGYHHVFVGEGSSILNLTSLWDLEVLSTEMKDYSTPQCVSIIDLAPVWGFSHQSALIRNIHIPIDFSIQQNIVVNCPQSHRRQHHVLYHSAAVYSLFYDSLTKPELVSLICSDYYPVLLEWFNAQNFNLNTSSGFENYILKRSFFNLVFDVITQAGLATNWSDLDHIWTQEYIEAFLVEKDPSLSLVCGAYIK